MNDDGRADWSLVQLHLAEDLARERTAGHLTIMRFGSGWKIGLGTPELLNGDGYGQVWHQPTYRTFGDALTALLVTEQRIDHCTDVNPCTGYPCLVHESNRAGVKRMVIPVPANGTVTHEPLVKFYKDTSDGSNGAFTTSTTATDADDFLRATAEVLPQVLRVLQGDEEFTLDKVLPQICEIWAKLHGYKADNVFEERRLVIGTPRPEALWYLNETQAD